MQATEIQLQVKQNTADQIAAMDKMKLWFDWLSSDVHEINGILKDILASWDALKKAISDNFPGKQ